MAEYVCNAIIESATIRLDLGCFLCPWVFLDYGGSGQGFGGYVCGATKDAKAGDHKNQPNLAAEFIVRCLEAAGVEEWSKLAGKTIRVKKTDEWGDIVAIGHIVKDDKWFSPREVFDSWKEPARD